MHHYLHLQLLSNIQIIVACVHCKKPIYEYGTFSGRYHIINKENTVHEECREDFTEQLIEQQAEKCVDCGKGIRPGGKFSGAYYGEIVTFFLLDISVY